MGKNIKYIIICILILIVTIIVAVINKNSNKEQSDDGKFKIVTSFYPIYVMTLNITDGANNIELVNMADINTGCIHDYTLVAADMKKVENADVFIENGLGLESFIEKITNSNKKLQVINSSENISNLIQDDDETNPHIWTSISNYMEQVENIQKALSKINPENSKIYETNAKEYINKLKELKSKYEGQLKGKEAVSLNESFDYLAKEIGLNLTSIHTSHEENTMSAEMLKSIIEKMKSSDIKIIIVDENDNLKNAQTIAKETGAKIYKLDSALSGDFSKESYINSMNENLEKLKDNK